MIAGPGRAAPVHPRRRRAHADRDLQAPGHPRKQEGAGLCQVNVRRPARPKPVEDHRPPRRRRRPGCRARSTRSSSPTASPARSAASPPSTSTHLEIPRGAITALIGPNGAGKTTFFNLLTGFDKPDAGTWTFDGTLARRRARLKVARMGLVRTFQLTKALGLLTVLENMKLGAKGQRGENLFRSALPVALAQAGRRDRGEGHRAARDASSSTPRRTTTRRPLRRPAQAARDGPRAHERPDARDARRADGRREPGAHAVAARPHPRPEGRRA